MRRYGAIIGTGLALLLAFQACNGQGGPGLSPEMPPAERPEESAAISVDSPGDEVARDGVVTLREAMALATGELSVDALDGDERRSLKGSPGSHSADTIKFDSDEFPSEEPVTVALMGTLPVFDTEFDTVDASEAGVVIDGGQRQFPCFHVDSPGNSLRGVVIQNCHTGVLLDFRAGGNVIGGPDKGEGNVISGNTVGIEIRGSANLVQGNYIGLDPTGSSAVPNAFEGIWIAPGGKDNVIGGVGEGKGNVISGNDLFGVSVDGQGTSGNVLLGNLIGTDATGRVAVGNQYGVVIQGGAQGNTVGGDEPDEGNVISGNNTGLLLRHAETRQNVVRGNYMGYARDGATPIGNVVNVWTVDGATDNLVEDNVLKETP